MQPKDIEQSVALLGVLKGALRRIEKGKLYPRKIADELISCIGIIFDNHENQFAPSENTFSGKMRQARDRLSRAAVASAYSGECVDDGRLPYLNESVAEINAAKKLISAARRKLSATEAY